MVTKLLLLDLKISKRSSAMIVQERAFFDTPTQQRRTPPEIGGILKECVRIRGAANQLSTDSASLLNRL